MKKEIVYKVLRIVGTILSFFNFLMFFAMRPCWSGISSTLGYKGGSNTFLYILPILICILLFVILLADLILKKLFAEKNWIHIVFLALGFVFFIAIIFIIILGAKDYMRFVWPKFFVALAITLMVICVYCLIFIYPKTSLKDNRIFKYGLLGIVSTLAVGVLLHFTVNRITYRPVVYAVEDKYQITFSTSAESVGWVEVDGTNYYDSYAGSSRKFSKIHKVEIPMTALDNAKHYTVHAKKNIYSGPFGGWLGRDLTQSVDFRPVDTSDGLQYMSFSDIHMNNKIAVKTAHSAPKYDFLVLAGDIISDVETFDDANFNNLVAHQITGGEMPVVYARGNHDVKGKYGEELHKFVGAKNEDFFYNFYFNDVYGLVLDLGEDHDDDWWEYYDTAHYEEYHQRQLQFLQAEIDRHAYDAYKYHMVAIHIPPVFVNYRHDHENVKPQMTALLNQMDIDMVVCGHQHFLMIFEPGLITPNTKLTYNPNYKNGTYNGYLTDFNFPCLMVSKQGFTYSDNNDLFMAKSHIGLYVNVDLVNNKETCYWLNSRGEKVKTMNMFYEKDYGEQIVIDLDTKTFSA